MTDESKQWALVRDGEIITGPTPHRGEETDSGKWLPVVNVDSELFDIKTQWRLKPSLVVEADRVVRLYPIVEKSWKDA